MGLGEREIQNNRRGASHMTADVGASTVVHIQQAANSPLTSSPPPLSTPSSTSAALRIQQATISESQQFTIAGYTMPPSSDPTLPATSSESAAPTKDNHGLSQKSIVGLAIIPVVVIVVVVLIFGYLWLRKRRKQAPIIRHLGPSPPLPLEKDFHSPTFSIDSKSSGKVCSMTAFSTPLAHTGWHASPRLQNNNSFNHMPWNNVIPEQMVDVATPSSTARGGGVDAVLDSPIDRSSPFRLKRGNTNKRSSLDSDLMSAWPVPPQPIQPARGGSMYTQRRSISEEYFRQERIAQDEWEEIRIGLGPDPGPTVKDY